MQFEIQSSLIILIKAKYTDLSVQFMINILQSNINK